MNLLEEILKKASQDASYRPEFHRILLESDLYVITTEEQNRIGKRLFKKGDELKLVTMTDSNNVTYVPIYSSFETLQKSIEKEVPYFVIKGNDLFQIIAGSKAYLNPQSEYRKIFTEVETKQIAEGENMGFIKRWGVQKNTQVFVGKPSVYPHKLINDLTELFKKYNSVKRAFLVHFCNPEANEPPHSLVIIDAPQGPEQLFKDAGLVASESVEKDEYVDIMKYNSDTFCKSIETDFKPFFTGM